MKQSLYLETTIPSYLAARTSSNLVIAGRQAVTHDFWEDERHFLVGKYMEVDFDE